MMGVVKLDTCLVDASVACEAAVLYISPVHQCCTSVRSMFPTSGLYIKAVQQCCTAVHAMHPSLAACVRRSHTITPSHRYTAQADVMLAVDRGARKLEPLLDCLCF